MPALKEGDRVRGPDENPAARSTRIPYPPASDGAVRRRAQALALQL